MAWAPHARDGCGCGSHRVVGVHAIGEGRGRDGIGDARVRVDGRRGGGMRIVGRGRIMMGMMRGEGVASCTRDL